MSRLPAGHYDTSATSTPIVRDWRQDAECGREGTDPERWFPVGDSPAAQAQTEAAREICHGCPVMDECRAWALDSGLDDGVAGGLTEKERRNIRKRPRGHTAVLAACGTEAALRRHQRNGQSCLVCLDGQRRRRAAQYVRKSA